MLGKDLMIDGTALSDFGVSISVNGTYGGAGTALERIAVPGRNGDLLRTQNRMENLTVQYKGHVYLSVREKLDELRDFLLSVPGYRRIEDTEQPDIYRMGAFVGDFDPKIFGYRKGATFTLAFTCKPQRFLKIGENTVWIARVFDKALDTATGYVGTAAGASYGLVPLALRPVLRLKSDTAATVTVQAAYFRDRQYFTGTVETLSVAVAAGGETTVEVGDLQSIPATGQYVRFSLPGVAPEIEHGLTGVTVLTEGSGTVPLYNFTPFTARPFIRAAPVWDGSVYKDMTITVGGKTVTVTGLTYAHIGLDSEDRRAYWNNVELDNCVAITENGQAAWDYPTFPPGDTQIAMDAGTDHLEIVPHWFRA